MRRHDPILTVKKRIYNISVDCELTLSIVMVGEEALDSTSHEILHQSNLQSFAWQDVQGTRLPVEVCPARYPLPSSGETSPSTPVHDPLKLMNTWSLGL